MPRIAKPKMPPFDPPLKEGFGMAPDDELRLAYHCSDKGRMELALAAGARVDSIPIQELLDKSLLDAAAACVEYSDMLWAHASAPAGLAMEPPKEVVVPNFVARAKMESEELEGAPPSPRRARLAELALRAGANPRAALKAWFDDWKPLFTALELAAKHGQLAVVDALLAAGVDPNVRGPKHWTPLMHAAEEGHVAVAARLAALVENLDAKNPQRKTALDLAKDPEDSFQGPGHVKVCEALSMEAAKREALEIGKAAGAGAGKPRSRI